MKTKRVELGDIFYVFTNWGLCKGRVVKVIDEIVEEPGTVPTTGLSLYKLNIDVDDYNKNKKYGFLFKRHQLFNSVLEALDNETEKWGMQYEIH